MRLARTLGFVGLFALGAHAKVVMPESGIPLSLQTFFVLLAGAVLGPWEALSSVAIYLSLGAAGVPLFTGAGGVAGTAYLIGRTGGYLVGFAVAVLIVGFVARHTSRCAILGATFLMAALAILVCGTAYLWLGLNYTFLLALNNGFLPFVIGDVIKALLALVVYTRIKGIGDA
jgi:biotin transport system substrate-specific component